MSARNSEEVAFEEGLGLEIYTFGYFKLSNGEKYLSGKSGRFNKSWELLMYLITNRDILLPPEAIQEALWPDSEGSDPGKKLKNLVHRLRKKIDPPDGNQSDSAIIYSRGCYSWNRDLNYWLDAEAFESLCKQGRELSSSEPEKAISKYLEAFYLYSGDYLPELSLSDWVIPIRHYYSQLYLRSVVELLDLCRKTNRNSEITMICEKAFLIENFEEELHLHYLEALLKEGKTVQARNHYQYITALLYREFSARPSEAMQTINKKICRGSSKKTINFSDIQELTKGCQVFDGAMFCDPEAFDLICKLEKRRAVRGEHSLFVATITLTDPNYIQPPVHILSEAMAIQKEVLFYCLRKGDVFAQWNESQYLVLLPTVSLSDVEVIMQRVVSNFKQKAAKGDVIPRSSIHQLMSNENDT